MYPIVHYCINKKILPNGGDLLALGGLFPDLGTITGIERNEAHGMGEDFCNWCLRNDEASLPFAIGVLAHGCWPAGVDYYADESWPGGEKGYCFQRGVPYMEKLRKATNLPEELIWWKAHNFVEMSFELLANEMAPTLGQELLLAADNQQVIAEVANTLVDYKKVEESKVFLTYARLRKVFALDPITPQQLAEKQVRAFAMRHNVYNPNVPAMSDIIQEMAEQYRDEFPQFMNYTLIKVHQMVQDICGKEIIADLAADCSILTPTKF